MKISIVVDIVVERSEIFCSMTESSGFYLLDAITETSICVICQFRSASDVELKIQHIILKLFLGQFRTVAFTWKNSIYVWLLVM